MKVSIIAGILLVVAAGVLPLAYQGITYTQQKKIIDLGQFRRQQRQRNTFPYRPCLD